MSTAADKTKTDRFPRKDVFFIPVTQVQEIKGSIEFGGKTFFENVRKDYGDIQLLAKQIIANSGIRNPCKGFKKDGVYYLTDGHRRYTAAQHILKTTGEVIDIPLMSENGITEEKRVLDMIICNEGKPLNPVEQADAVFRLIEGGMEEKEIRDKTGFSNVYICNLKMLFNAPKEIKDKVSENMISGTLAMTIMRKEKDYDKAIETIENAIAFKQENANTSKITLKDITKSNKKVNSFSAVKKAYKHYEKHDRTVRQDKVDLFAFIARLMEGDVSYDELMASLYEPEEEKEPRRKKSESTTAEASNTEA